MQIRLAGPITTDSIVDGEGIRSVIWTQGCIHNCKGCHNPETHSFKEGILADIEEIKKQLKVLKFQDGITLSGGDPMCQTEACLEIAKYAKELNLNVWCYTGYTFDQLLALSKEKKTILELLQNIDVLVDGKFILAKKSYNVKFRGSTNQRIIDVKKSLETNSIVEIEKYRYQEETTPHHTQQCIFI